MESVRNYGLWITRPENSITKEQVILMTEKEILQAILQRFDKLEAGQAKLEVGQAKLEAGQAKLEAGQAEIKERLTGIEKRLDSVEHTLNATYVQIARLTEFRTEANSKLAEISEKIIAIEAVTKENLFDIAKLKLAK
jgi:septal ring factor EnvC (AmiA/AmiB activator)